jgi:putative ABC transport system substrate-binding protein
MMRRREVISLLAGAAAAWPLASRAQQPAMPVIGFLSSLSFGYGQQFLVTFRQGLSEAGYVEGRDVSIEYRWADNQYDRLPSIAAELLQRPLAAMVASGGSVPVQAAKAATITVPIIFTAAAYPVEVGLVASLPRPGGNITGIASLTAELDAKRMGMLREFVPAADAIGVLVNPSNPSADIQRRSLQSAAQSIGLKLVVVPVATERQLDAAFATLIRERVGGLLIAADPFFADRRVQLVALVAHHAVPAMYQFREITVVGGLMSYGLHLPDNYRQAGIYTGRILKGAKPADLPVMQPTKFELVINLKTAKSLGLQIPDRLLALADEVIE